MPVPPEPRPVRVAGPFCAFPGVRMGLVALGALLLPGCYVYSAIDPDVVPPGQEIRVTVTQEGAAELAQVREQTELVPVIRGSLVERDPQTLMVRVPIRSGAEGLQRDIGQVVGIPIGSVLAIERRDLSVGRTGLFVAGSAGAAALVVFAIMEATGSARDNGPDGPDLFTPLFSIPFR